MIDIVAILKNTEGYKLTMIKRQCDKPGDTYRIILSEEVKIKEQVSVREHTFYMTEEELSYFARALLC